MVRKPKDTDYLFISAWLRCREGSLLNRQRMERMLDAKTNEEAAKILSECGYEVPEALTVDTLNRTLSRHREQVYGELSTLCPNSALVDVFRVKYDYHNAKALVKCGATGKAPEEFLVEAGTCSWEELKKSLADSEGANIPQRLQEAMGAAKEVLAATGDPQKSDTILDRACFGEMLSLAEESGSDFLRGYIKLQIDLVNLKTALRVRRMKKNQEFLKQMLIDGGNVPCEDIAALHLAEGSFESLYTGDLQEAAALADEAALGGRQTAFERACDNVLGAYIRGNRMVPFGESVVVSYLAAKENEITQARIIMSGRLAGVSGEAIRERLRDSYV